MDSCGVEEARSIIERAREHVAAAVDDGGDLDNGNNAEERGTVDGGGKREGGGEGKEHVVPIAEGIRSLIRATWEVVKEWCDEEAEARVRRKDSQV